MVTLRTLGVWLADIFPVIREPARALYNRLPNYLHDTPVKLIAKAFPQDASFFFVNIGANDGVAGDPLVDLIRHNAQCTGIFVEPVPFLFERLCRNYGPSERFVFENVAIDDRNGVRTFYYLNRSQCGGKNELPGWSEEIGAFDKSHILRHFPTLDASRILSSEVESITLSALFERNSVRCVDLLVMDVEGYELVVLNQIDFDRIRPKIIMFEHKHLPEVDFCKAKAMLTGKDYRLIQYGRDTIAVRVN